ncbi:3-oxoacyl-[acyl-carrier-protein] reductase [bacterium]|nr:3-oxoacyl-[acyl-carrier-protein] reductase [bacterium]
MNIDLKDKVALVTGSAQGIGLAIALKLKEAGATVIGWDLDEKGLEELKKLTGEEVYKVNVASFAEVEKAAEKVLEKYKKVDILVNNAGITRDNLVMRMEESEWDSVLAVNLKSAFNTVKAFNRNMLRNRWGRIINMASVIGLMGNAGQANYAASKGGLIAFTKSIAKEFASRNILVNAIAPGFIETKMTAKLGEENMKEYFKVIPLKKFGQPEDVANIVLFLSSELSNYVTGQVINCDGGMIM